MYGQSVANLICQPTCDVLWNDSMSRVPLDRIRFYRDRHGILIRSANFLKSTDVNLTDSFKFPLGRFLQVAAENIPMILERNDDKTAYRSVCPFEKAWRESDSIPLVGANCSHYFLFNFDWHGSPKLIPSWQAT